MVCWHAWLESVPCSRSLRREKIQINNNNRAIIKETIQRTKKRRK
jgi:hypothetical protein